MGWLFASPRPVPGAPAAPRRRIGALVVALCMALPAAANPVRVVVHPRPESDGDTRSEYFVRVLDLALSRSGADYRLQAHALQMPKSRALMQLERHDGVDVVWAVSTADREHALRPIRVPIDKGLLGWRLLLINKSAPPDFDHVRTLEQLRQFTAGQGHDWPDAAILASNGIPLELSADYEGLFRMLQARRFDFFPRSVAEIWDEQARHAGMDFQVERSLALHYPACIYFFVNRSDPELARDIERGLQRAIADGSFDALFERFHGELLQRARLNERTVIELKNPGLPEPAARYKDLWFKP